MSKLLKFIVDFFMLTAIVVAAAILVPPLLGVNQTIVDSAAMVTNLPLGSVTYSHEIDVADLKAGDEILKETDAATYAYIIRSGDETTGQYNVVSSYNPEGAEEQIYLRNSVPKIAVIIPYIGYLMIAMHSVEGIILLALAVILVIILFVLSELWKTNDEEEEEEYSFEDVALPNDDEIDTRTIREAMRANVEAVNREDSGVSDDEELTPAQRKAREKAKLKAEKKARKDAKRSKTAYDEADTGEQSGGAAAGGNSVLPELTIMMDDEQGQPLSNTQQFGDVLSAAAAAQMNRVIDDDEITFEGILPVRNERPAPVKAAPKPEKSAFPEEDEDVKRVSAEMAVVSEKERSEAEEEEVPSGAQEAGAEEEHFEASLPDSEEAAEEPVKAEAPERKSEPELPKIMDYSNTSELVELTDVSKLSGRAARAEASVLNSYDMEEEEEVRFTMIERQSLNDMIDQAKAEGDEPVMRQGAQSGVTIVDYSKLL